MNTATACRSLSLGVAILAAGASSRMGRPKLLLRWGENSILGRLLAQWTNLGAEQTLVVCAADNRALADELDRLGFPSGDRVFNPFPERGMFSSIQCAAQWAGWNPHLTHWAIVLGDQPHLRPTTLQALLDFAAAHPQKICQPRRQGRARHPVVLPAKSFRELADSPDETLRQFLQRRTPDLALCELDDPGLDFDLDTPADYERALRLFFNPA